MTTKARGIAHAVGRNGLNRKSDVAVVQRLLNRALERNPKFKASGIEKLIVDEDCGVLTIGAIEAFQSKALGWSGRAVDGTVEPHKTTWKALNGNVASVAKIKRAVAPRPMWVGSYAAFRQGDYKEKLGDSTSATIAAYGCAMCTLTMAATYIGSPTKHWPEELQPSDLTPLKVNEILRKAGAFSGYALRMSRAAGALGMEHDEYGRVEDLKSSDVLLIDEHLRRGYPVACHVDYKKNSAGDHWILLITRQGNGTYTTIDPATGRTLLLSRGDGMTVNNPRYPTTKGERTAVLFGWAGSGGSAAQEKYLVVRFALLAPQGGVFVCE